MKKTFSIKKMKKFKRSTIFQLKFSGDPLLPKCPYHQLSSPPPLPPASPDHTLYPSPPVYHPQYNPIYQPNPLASYEQQYCLPTNSSCNSNKTPLNFNPFPKPLSQLFPKVLNANLITKVLPKSMILMTKGGLKHKIQDMIDSGTVGRFPKLIQADHLI